MTEQRKPWRLQVATALEEDCATEISAGRYYKYAVRREPNYEENDEEFYWTEEEAEEAAASHLARTNVVACKVTNIDYTN